jgi:hypothetical protein
MMRAHLTSATARLVDAQMRHSAMPAMAEVARRLGVDAEWIVFGHVHRAGPRDEAEWRPFAAGPRLLNTGAWLYEPMLVDRARPPHPHWPGGAALLQPGRPPQSIGLLDDLSPAQLTGPVVEPATASDLSRGRVRAARPRGSRVARTP